MTTPLPPAPVGTLSAEFDAFHDHLDTCPICAEEFCDEGKRLFDHATEIAGQDHPPAQKKMEKKNP